MPRRSARWSALALCVQGFAVPAYSQSSIEIRPRGAEASAVRPAYEPIRRYSPPEVTDAKVEKRIAVAGAVHAPATFRTTRVVTCGDLIEAARGPTSDASATVYVVRGGRILQGFYDPTRSATNDPIGPLLDGDVVILRPLPGVRTAHYQTVRTADGSSLEQGQVAAAEQSRPVHIVCVNAAERPVVLPLAATDARQEVLLLQLLQLPRDIRPEAIRLFPPTGHVPQDGTLQDGTVVVLDPRLIPAGGVRPVEPFPQAVDLDAPAETGDGPAPGDPTALSAPPGETSSSSVQPVSAQTLSSDSRPSSDARELLNPVNIPGVPFVVREPVVVASNPYGSPSPIVNSLHTEEAPTHGVLVPRSLPEPGDSRPLLPRSTTSAPGEVVGASALLPRRGGEFSTERALVTPQIAPTRTLNSRSPAPLDSETATTDSGFPHWKVIVGTILTALTALGMLIWWNRRERARLQLATILEATVPPATPAPSEQPSTRSLQQLIDDRLPMVEEPSSEIAALPLHGAIVGHRKLIFDSAHVTARGPHFAAERATSGSRRSARHLEHLAAALSGRRSRSATTPHATDDASASEPPVIQPPQAQTPPPATGRRRYDTIEPEQSAHTRTAGSETGGAAGINRQIDRLARALNSLQRERP